MLIFGHSPAWPALIVCFVHWTLSENGVFGALFFPLTGVCLSFSLRAFFWLVSLLLSSLVWFISVQISDKDSAAQQKGLLIFGVVLSVVLQETFRFAYYKLLKWVWLLPSQAALLCHVFLWKEPQEKITCSVSSRPKRLKLFYFVVIFVLSLFLSFYWISCLDVTDWCCIHFLKIIIIDFCRKANEGLLTLSQEETMPISTRQLAYGTVIVCQCDVVDAVTDTQDLPWKDGPLSIDETSLLLSPP